MSEITRDELNEVFRTINQNHAAMNKVVTSISVDIAIVKTKVAAIKIPKIPDRPCDDFKEHISAHKDSIDSWRKPVIVGIILLAITVITKVIPELILLMK